MGDIDKDLQTGKEGEDFVFTRLMNFPHTQQILDVRDRPECRARDVDFIWTPKDGSAVEIEVKAEQQYTGNLFAEVIGNVRERKDGWFLTSAANHIAYCFLKRRICFLFALEPMRDYVFQRQSTYKRRTSHTTKEGRLLWTSEGLLVPIDEVSHLFDHTLSMQ